SHPPPGHAHPLSLHDALPISSPFRLLRGGRTRSAQAFQGRFHGPFDALVDVTDARQAARHYPTKSLQLPTGRSRKGRRANVDLRSEEHTSELQSRENLVYRLL